MYRDEKVLEEIRKSKPDYMPPKAYAKDAEIVHAILDKKELTAVDRAILITIYKSAYHDSGKIEGCTSCDSSAHGCEFCEKMRKAAEKDPSIICGKCYDVKQENYRLNVALRHALNLAIMASVSFTVEELRGIPVTPIIRINSSGDIDNVTHAENMIKIAIANPFAHCALWSKNVPCVEKAFDKVGKPENMVFVQSSIHINKADKRSRYADYTFTVYTPDRIEQAFASGSMTCNGRKCRECGYKCYFGTWEKGSDIAEVLR